MIYEDTYMQKVYAATPEIIKLIEADRAAEAIDKILAFPPSKEGTRYRR